MFQPTAWRRIVLAAYVAAAIAAQFYAFAAPATEGS